MQTTKTRPEESLGLILALVGHAALIAWLVWYKPGSTFPPSERMTVSLSDDVGLTASGPQSDAEAAPDKGPEQGDAPPPPAASAPPAPQPSAPAVQQRQAAKTPPPPAQKQNQAQPQKPQIRASAQQAAKPTPKPGASAFDNAFKPGVQGAKPTGTAANPPAAITGPIRASLAGAIARQLKVRWRGRAPTGIDADKLVTILAWDLNPDGTLGAGPRVVRQEGITPANRAQAARHAEEAMRAVRLAAPFNLPPQYYAGWRRIAEFRFDRSLGQ